MCATLFILVVYLYIASIHELIPGCRCLKPLHNTQRELRLRNLYNLLEVELQTDTCSHDKFSLKLYKCKAACEHKKTPELNTVSFKTWQSHVTILPLKLIKSVSK